MQTTLHYLQDSDVLTLNGCNVLSCSPYKDNLYAVVLNITPFFPEGGGQPGDVGTIGSVSVTDTVEKDGLVLHITTSPLAVGSTVTASVDIDTRMVNTQQHTGEHLLSYAYDHLFGAKNVGFHWGDHFVQIDLDTPLTPDQITEGELYANRAVWQNLPIDIMTADDSQLDMFPLRKVSDKLSGDIRIVWVKDNDCCACCGTHFKSTAPVGIIKVLKSESYKGGMRITFACGKWALEDYQIKNGHVNTLAASFSVKPHQLPEAIDRLKKENGNLAGALHSRSVMLAEALCKDALANAVSIGKDRLCCTTLPLSDKERKLFVNSLTQNSATFALALSVENDRLFYLCGASNDCSVDCKYVCDVLNGLTGGRGGGKPKFAQGSGKADMDPDTLFESVCSLLTRALA